jgi:hypothetical protein
MARRQALQFRIEEFNQLPAGTAVTGPESGHQPFDVRCEVERHSIILTKYFRRT